MKGMSRVPTYTPFLLSIGMERLVEDVSYFPDNGNMLGKPLDLRAC